MHGRAKPLPRARTDLHRWAKRWADRRFRRYSMPGAHFLTNRARARRMEQLCRLRRPGRRARSGSVASGCEDEAGWAIGRDWVRRRGVRADRAARARRGNEQKPQAKQDRPQRRPVGPEPCPLMAWTVRSPRGGRIEPRVVSGGAAPGDLDGPAAGDAPGPPIAGVGGRVRRPVSELPRARVVGIIRAWQTRVSKNGRAPVAGITRRSRGPVSENAGRPVAGCGGTRSSDAAGDPCRDGPRRRRRSVLPRRRE
jgi:hypothetical protein